MNHIQRLRQQMAADYAEPIEVVGAASDDVQKYVPLAASAASELISAELKKSEEAKKKAAYEKSEAGQAAKAARESRQKADLARADAVGEADPNGPKHKAAAELEREAQVAEARSAVLNPGSGGGGGGGGAMVKHAGAGGSSFFEKYKWPLIGGGAFLGLGILVLALRRR